MDRPSCARITFSAPFHTGIILDFSRLLEEGYGRAQGRILRQMGNAGLPGRWSADDSAPGGSATRHAPSDQVLFDPARIRGKTAIPRYFLRYRCLGSEMGDSGAVDDEIAGFPQDSFALRLDGIRVRLYDYGFGSIVVALEGESDAGCDFSALKRFGEAFESKLDALFGGLLAEIVSRFGEATGRLQDTEYSFSGRACRLLWTHRLFHLECPQSDLDEFASAAANAIIDLQYNILRDSTSSFVNSQNMRLYTGKGNSLVVTATDSPFDDTSIGLPNLLSRVLLTTGVFDAVTESLHQKLLRSSNKVALDSREGSIKQLETVSDTIIRHTQFINHIKALRSQYKFSLDPNSLAIWNAIDAAWEAQERWQYVEDQGSELEKLHTRIMAEISRQQQRTLNLSVIFSLAVSVLAAIVGVMAVFQQTFLQKVLVVVASTAAISAATVWFWRRIYRR